MFAAAPGISMPVLVNESKITTPTTAKFFTTRNSKFEEFLNNRNNATSNQPAPVLAPQIQIQTTPPTSVNHPPPVLTPQLPTTHVKPETRKRKSEDSLTKSQEKKKPQERNQFGPTKKCYERYWCIGCDNWINGGKSSATNHLLRRHEYEECQIIMITNQGMLKVDKENFAPDKNKPKKEAQQELDDSGLSLDSSLNSSIVDESSNTFNFNLTLYRNELGLSN